jgi:hypothetical protein
MSGASSTEGSLDVSCTVWREGVVSFTAALGGHMEVNEKLGGLGDI